MYFKRHMESLTESEIISNEEALKIQSIHPYEIISDKNTVIQEVSLSKEKIGMVFQKAIIFFSNLTKEMMKIAFNLKKRNAGWFQTVSRFNLERKDFTNFKFEMFNYEEGIKRIENILIPEFDSINPEDFSGGADVFKQTAFKNLYLKDENGNEDISKNYFRGGAEKIVIDRGKVKPLFSFAFNWLQNYEKFVRKIEGANIELNNATNKVLDTVKEIITESTILTESIFKDEYYDILLEDAVDPGDIEKEEKEGNTIETNKEENKQSKESSNRIEAVKKYWKICSTIQTMKMDIAKEAYSVFTDFIDKVIS